MDESASDHVTAAHRPGDRADPQIGEPTGDLPVDHTAEITGDHTGDHTGEVTGAHTGDHTGEVTGDHAREPTDAGHGSPRVHAVAPYLIVLAVGVWLGRAFWLPGGYVVGFDTFAYSGPNLEVTERALREWRLPLVNDLIFAGVPHLGNPQAMVLYPPHVLTLAMENNRAMGVIVAGHLVLLGIGMLLLARRLGMSRLAATSAAVVAMAAGSTLTKTVQYEQILVLAWLPMLLTTVHGALASPRPMRWMAGLSATTAAVLLAGHPQLVYQSIVVTVAATIGFAWGDQRWRRLPYLVGGAVLGACIALPQLLAALYSIADSAITGGRSIDELSTPALSLTPSLTARALLGTVEDVDPAVFAGGFESVVFVGVVVAILAVVGLVHAVSTPASRPWAISFAVVAALALVWAIGPRTVLFRGAFELLPGFDLARSSARWLVVVGLVAGLFAGLGVDAVRQGATRRQLVAVGVAIVLIATLIVAGVLVTADRRSTAIWVVTAIVTVGLLAATLAKRPRVTHVSMAIVALAAIELTLMSLHSFPQSVRKDAAFDSHATATTEFLVDQPAGSVIALTDDVGWEDYLVPGLRPNANVLFEIRSADGYDGGVQVTERWAEALRRFTPTPNQELPLRNSLSVPVEPGPLARLGVRYVLLDRDRPADVFVPGWSGPAAVDELFEVWENPEWVGDAVAWPRAIVSDDPADLLRERPEVAAGAAIVGDVADGLECRADSVGCSARRVEVERPQPERIDLSVDLDRPAIVSVAQQALPGWDVTVDGDRADVVVVDGLFLGVRVGSGVTDISFRYSSPHLAATLVVSVLAVLATIGIAVGDVVAHHRRRRST